MTTALSESEELVLTVILSAGPLSMEDVVDRIPELTWHEIFHAVDALSRRGVVQLRRHRFAYHLSSPTAASV